MEHPSHSDRYDLRSFAEPGRGHQLEHTFGPGSRDNFALRLRATVVTQAFGQKAAILPGICDGAAPCGPGVSNPPSAFHLLLAQLKARADRIALLDPDEMDTAEYGHQAALFWADVVGLKGFIGTSPTVTQVVAELQKLHLQFLRKDTPPAIFQTLATALGGLIGTACWDACAVDRFVKTLEQAKDSSALGRLA
jgi:hypothetical protein